MICFKKRDGFKRHNENLKHLIVSIFLFSFAITTANSQKSFSIQNAGLVFKYELYNNKNLRLISMLPKGFKPINTIDTLNAEINAETFLHLSGENRDAHHGAKMNGASASTRLIFVEKKERELEEGREVVLVQHDPVKNLKVESYYEFNARSPVVRRYTVVTNMSREAVGIEYISSGIINNLGNIAKGLPQQNLLVHYAYNSWMQEAQWKTSTPSQLGWENTGAFNLNGVFFTNIGSFSSIKSLPMAMVENKKAGIIWFWQIEHNGSWHWELSNNSSWDATTNTYLYLGGPDEEHHHAWKNLQPGQSYKTVPVAIGCVKGGFTQAVEALTNYRRKALLRANADNITCPVIFNDYMNSLSGNPTTAKELPLIDAAAKAGCDYYVIDACWYAEINERWWTAVGLWQPSKTRFPAGLPDLLGKIKANGMKPGLWLEIEVAGINSPLKDKPDNWFMMRHGKRVQENGRYLLDFRNADVVAHANEVVNRLVQQYGASYIKMDYNINALMGTETDTESLGQGLLEHNRAVLDWYKSIQEKYAELVVENCGSGGCRMDYAMLSQTQLQSSSDQSDYRKYPAILVGCMAAVLPEQLAIWSYPKRDGNAKESSFNMVNAMLGRIHQSGHLAELPKESLAQVVKGIDVYKKILAPVIPKAYPFFPLGMPSMADEKTPVSLGLRNGNKLYIAVWRLKGDAKVLLPDIKSQSVKLIYPTDLGIRVSKMGAGVEFIFPDNYMAAIIEVSK